MHTNKPTYVNTVKTLALYKTASSWIVDTISGVQKEFPTRREAAAYREAEVARLRTGAATLRERG